MRAGWSRFPALLLALLAPNPAAAGNPGQANGLRESPKPPVASRPAAPVLVQLLPLMAPTRSRAGVVPVTPFVGIKAEMESSAICGRVPRIRDAIVSTLHNHPIPLADGVPDLTDAAGPLKASLAAVVEGDVVVEVRLMEGSLRMGQGVESLLPFAKVVGCVVAGGKSDGKKKGGH